jgi:extracellular elastinolytic metalloproteinase
VRLVCRRAAVLAGLATLILTAATASGDEHQRRHRGHPIATIPADPPSIDLRNRQHAALPRMRATRRSLRGSLGAPLVVEVERTTGTPRVLIRRDGFLTEPSNRRPAEVALDHVREHERAFRLDRNDLSRLKLVRRYRSESGVTHLQWAQTYRDVRAFGAGLRANVDERGRLINIGGSPQADLAVDSMEPTLSPLDALLAAARGARQAVVPGLPGAADGPERNTAFSGGHEASLTLFVGAHRTRLAWRVLLRVDDLHVYDAVVDAEDGRLLYRADLVRNAAALAFDNYPGAPAGGVQVAKTFSETGIDPWLTADTRLSGHNAHVYSDPNDVIDGRPPDPSPAAAEEIGPSSPGAWNYVHTARPPSAAPQHCPPTPGCSWSNFNTTFSWRVNRAQAGTQLFYFVNRFHDHLRDAPGIGFDDSSGNFEAGDRVLAQVDDGASTDTGVFDDFPACNYTNNAGVLPLPDGTPLLMQIYLWTSACSPGSTANDVNAADDAQIIYHEYTHGLTNRLVTDPAGFGALNGPQSAAMDEGFADWYAWDMLNADGFEPDSATPGELRAGKYVNDPLRTQAIDCPVGAGVSGCPGSGGAGPGGYTFGDFGKVFGQPEVHADGEIWGETLWDLRSRLVSDLGVAEGVVRARALVTDGLRLSPADPSFLDMRNAILQADVNRGLRDRDRIWAVFAARGMGLGASTLGDFDTRPVEDFTAPPPLPAPGPPADTQRPVISRLSMTNRRFAVSRRRTPRVATPAQRNRPAPRGTVFRFRVSEPATLRIAVERSRRGRRVGGRCRSAKRHLRRGTPCVRYVAVGTLVRRALPAGRSRVTFSGRIGRRPLRPGVQRAVFSATDAAGNRSRRRALSFSIVRR